MAAAVTAMRKWLISFIASTNSDRSNQWKTLPKDLMKMIAHRLNSTDYFRAAGVCKSWRSLLLESDIFRPQHLWLLHHPTPTLTTLRFSNVTETKFLEIKLPKPVNGGRVICASKGWLVMAKGRSRNFLFNPVSGAVHRLPSLPANMHRRLYRVELSSPVASDCIVVAILDDCESIVVCKPGDTEWSITITEIRMSERKNAFLLDLLFCNEKLHVLYTTDGEEDSDKDGDKDEVGDKDGDEDRDKDDDGNEDEDGDEDSDEDGDGDGDEDGSGMIVDFFQPYDVERLIPVSMIRDVDDGESAMLEVNGAKANRQLFYRKRHTSYLVESVAGGVLLLHKLNISYYSPELDAGEFDGEDDEEITIEFDDDSADEEEKRSLLPCHSAIVGMRVMEIEEMRKGVREWREKGVGKEQAVFLSAGGRLSIPATSAGEKGEFRGNSAIFIMDNANPDDGEPYLISVNGVYDFKSKEMKRITAQGCSEWCSDFMWFSPNFRR